MSPLDCRGEDVTNIVVGLIRELDAAREREESGLDRAEALREELTAALLREQFAVEAGDAYRLGMIQSIHYAHRLQGENADLRQSRNRLLEEYRALRVSLLPPQAEGVAA